MNLNFKYKRFLGVLLVLFITISCEELLFEEDLSEKNVTILAPLNNTELTDTNVLFSWSNLEDADNFELQIANPAFSNATQVLVDSTLTATNFSFTLEPGNYEWRIRAVNEYSETPYTTVSFVVQTETFDNDISNEAVTLLAPGNETTVSTSPTNFTWEQVEFAEEYILQVATPDFENATQIVVDEVTSSTSFSAMLEDGTYEWRVKARNSGSETAYSTSSFNVATQQNFPDRQVVIISPPNNFVSNQTALNLQWEEVDEATLYRIQIVDPTTMDVINEQTTTQNNNVVTFPQGNYIWKVRAENNTENTAYTSQSIFIDSISPNVPVLLMPEDLETLPLGTVTFTWSREEIEGSVEHDRLLVYSDVSLSNLVINEEVNDNSFTTTLDLNQTYYWLMRAFDEAGNESEDSEVFSFTIE